jgi:polysaccharide transporter, PST family
MQQQSTMAADPRGAETAVAPTPRRVVVSSVILVTESVLRVAVTALVSFWIARRLGPEGFGILNAAMAMTWMLLVVAGLGLDVPAVLRLARARSQAQSASVLTTVLLLRLAAALPALAAAALLAWLLHGDDATALAVSLIVALVIVGYAPSVLDVWFRSRTQALPLSSARLAATVLSGAAKLWVLMHGADLVLLAWAVVVEAVAYSALLGLSLWRIAERPRGPWCWDATLARELLRQAAPLLIAAAVVMVYMKSDVVLLSALSNHTQTGLYALAQKLSEVLYIVPVAIVDSLYPALAARRQTADAQAGEGAAADQLMFDLAVASALIVVVASLALAAPLVRWIFGEAYAPTIGLFAVHAWTCVAVALDTARQRWLVAAGLQRRAPWLAGSGAAVAIALNLALVPWLGAMGAACTALAAAIVSALASSFLWHDLRPVARMQCRALWPWARLWRRWQGWSMQRAQPPVALP